MKIFDEFKEFAVKGNVVDMAIGIVIGAAFGTVVKSSVDDIITPPLGRILGGMDFSNLFVNLSPGTYSSLAAAKAAGAATINYGIFLNSIVSFLIVAWALFMVVKLMNRLKRQQPAPVSNTKICPHCQSSINIKASRCPFCTSQL
ncbi:MAG TPA: large conductance mechanosensitive channel protein MscL [Candidatus Kryptonia bacterium]